MSTRHIPYSGHVRGATWRFDQESIEHEAEQDSESAEHDEREPPTVVLADQSCEEATPDCADIHARLMQSHRP